RQSVRPQPNQGFESETKIDLLPLAKRNGKRAAAKVVIANGDPISGHFIGTRRPASARLGVTLINFS
ncbi:MAG TPA: hypothetical protein VE267_14765, partial [Bradyrhizobium sp.]|nr:hypothetical protein [Bradyrhizobium sp.]